MTWGCDKNNSRGDRIDDFITENNICLLNDGSYTYLHPATGTFTAIDLYMCSPDILKLKYHVIHHQVLIRFTINYSNIYLMTVYYCFCIFLITAIIIPFPKPGKVLSDPGSYRPIALTSCLCKTMERMVNSRLTWYLERHKVITEYHSGFRRRRSTVDNLVTLETSIRDAFVGRKHLVSIFFDLEKAYENMVFY